MRMSRYDFYLSLSKEELVSILLTKDKVIKQLRDKEYDLKEEINECEEEIDELEDEMAIWAKE